MSIKCRLLFNYVIEDIFVVNVKSVKYFWYEWFFIK